MAQFRFALALSGLRDGFWETVSQAWTQYVEGSPSFVWEHKLKKNKYTLKIWVKKPFKTPTSSRQEKVIELTDIQLGMEECEITKSQLALEQSAQINTFQSFRQEEEFLRLKSRSLWLQAGDKNTTFFHRQCRARLSRNHISEISTGEGGFIKGHEQLKQVARRHFQHLFQEDGLSNGEVFA